MSGLQTGTWWGKRRGFGPAVGGPTGAVARIMTPTKVASATLSDYTPVGISTGADGLIDALNQVTEQKLAEINTNMPGEIISYDAERNKAIVRPIMPKRLAGDDALPPPQIVEVPVVWPASNGGSASFTMPLQPGDGGMLAVQQRSTENWRSGNNGVPDDPRQFDLSDAVFIPGLSNQSTVAHAQDVVMKFNETEIRIKPDNTIIVGNGGGSITIDSAGRMTLKALTITIDTPSRNFVLENHSHPQGNDSGGDGEPNVGPPL